MNEFDLADALRKNPEALNIPGAALMKYGPEDYIGATMVMRGTMFFDGSHTPQVREAVCQCFEQYEALAEKQLTSLWREEPRHGPDRYPYAKAPKMRDLVKQLDPDDNLTLAYVSGKKPYDASAWQFYVFGLRAWQAKLGNKGLASLQFTLPLVHVEEHPQVFQRLFIDFAKRLKPVHGYGGHSLQLSLVRKEPNEPAEAMMVKAARGMDAGDNALLGRRAKIGIATHLKTIGWLTAINSDMVEKIGGLFAIRSELPHDWFALYDYGAGLVIQAGPRPNIAAVADDPLPAAYVLPNNMLKEVRVPEIGDLHYGSKDGEPRIVGKAAEDWLARFDVPEDQLLAYKAKLLNEPKLTAETTLPERLMPPR
jgi:hypothetical protein